MTSIRFFGAFWALCLLSLSAGSQNSVLSDETERSGNAVSEALEQARKTVENEMKNNQGLGRVSAEEGPPVYPKSSMPDVRDSYESKPRPNSKKISQKKYYGSQSTGSDVLDSLSGSSRIPDEAEHLKNQRK